MELSDIKQEELVLTVSVFKRGEKYYATSNTGNGSQASVTRLTALEAAIQAMKSAFLFIRTVADAELPQPESRAIQIEAIMALSHSIVTDQIPTTYIQQNPKPGDVSR